MISSICRVCLSANSQNKVIANTQLQTIFEKLTNKQLNLNDGRPESVCYLCHSVLERCCKFVDASQKSDEFFSHIIQNRVQLTEDIILLSKEKKALQTPFNLSTSVLTHVSVSINDHIIEECKVSSGNEILIKKEPNQKYVVLDPNYYSTTIAAKRWKRPLRLNKTQSKKESPSCIPELTYDKEGNSDASHDNESNENDSNHSEMSSDYKIENINATLEIKEIIKVEFEKTNDNKPNMPPKDVETNISKLELDKNKPNTLIQEKQLQFQLEENNPKKPLYCEFCLKNFKSHQYFKRHMRIHTGEKPYTCKYCKDSFRDSVILKQHVRDHMGCLFVCDVCAKRFKVMQHLKEHYKTHSGEKPFSCDKCPMIFAHKNSLVRHLRTHTGEKPYVCDRCSKQFAQTSNLRKHQSSCKGKTGKTRNTCTKCLCNKDGGNI